jgi:hypothetical protein
VLIAYAYEKLSSSDCDIVICYSIKIKKYYNRTKFVEKAQDKYHWGSLILEVLEEHDGRNKLGRRKEPREEDVTDSKSSKIFKE